MSDVDVTTSGAGSVGLIVEPIGSGATDSEFITTLQAITIAASGASSHGIIIGEELGADMSASGVTNTLTLTNVSSTTTGEGAVALILHGHTLAAPTASTFSASGSSSSAPVMAFVVLDSVLSCPLGQKRTTPLATSGVRIVPR